MQFWQYILLWILALLAPFGVMLASPPSGVMLGVGLPIIWCTNMPTTCRSGGGLLALPMAMVQVGSALGWLGVGISILSK